MVLTSLVEVGHLSIEEQLRLANERAGPHVGIQQRFFKTDIDLNTSWTYEKHPEWWIL